MIVDAGGGTIDVSSYTRNQEGNFEEIAAPQCSFVINTLKIANFFLLYIRYLPGLCFCDQLCKTIFEGYVAAKLGLLYYYSTSLPRLLKRLTLFR